jgi:hypothetical protein
MYPQKSKIKKLGALVAVLVSGGLLMGCHRSPEKRIDHISAKIASKLDFNEQQKGILQDITNEMKKDFADEKSIRTEKLNEMKSLLMAETLDTTKVKSMIKERQARMDAKVDKYLEKVAALHKTLTVEQKNEIMEKAERFQKHFE